MFDMSTEILFIGFRRFKRVFETRGSELAMKVILPLMLALAAPAIFGCKPARPVLPQIIVVRVSAARPVDEAGFRPKSEYIALLRGETETDLSFKVGGLLETIGRENGLDDWQEGAPVRKGEVLAALKQADFVAAEEAARAKRDLSESQYKRIVELRDKGATSPQEFDVAKADMDSSRATWAQADQALKDSVIRAPYGGTILARLANPGETIRPGNPVLKIANLDRMSAELGVPEKLVGSIQVGKEISVQVSAMEGQSFTGRISEVGVAAKEGARLFKVVVKLDNPKGLLKSGMTASVVLSEAQNFPAGSVAVPLSALVASSPGSTTNPLAVFVVEPDGKAHERAVWTDDIVRSSIVITAGLKPGEKVVTVGASTLYDGAPVDARPAETFDANPD